MRPGYFGQLALGLLVAFSFGAVSPVAAREAQEPRLILAFYHAAFDWVSWSQPLCDQPVTPYVSAGTVTLQRHVEQARGAGIDGFVLIWRGPQLVGNPTESNLRALLDHARQHDLAVAVAVDMAGGSLRTTDEVAGALMALRDGHVQHPAYLRVGERAVVFLLGQNALSQPSWEALRGHIDPDRAMLWIAEGPSADNLQIFDGLYLYDATVTDTGGLTLQCGDAVRLWNRQTDAAAYWVATVLPGYDDSYRVSPAHAFQRDRTGGEAYRSSWDYADASTPDWIVIRSFNEWPYCTQIEPSVTYGASYLDLTAALVARYRLPSVTVTATPTPTLVPSPTVIATPLTVPVTISTTLSPTPTSTIVSAVTLTPTATPFRLATPTPTPTFVIPEPRSGPVDGPTGEIPGDVDASWSDGRDWSDPAVAVTPDLRLPVEARPSRRCTLLPLLLPLAGIAAAARRRSA